MKHFKRRLTALIAFLLFVGIWSGYTACSNTRTQFVSTTKSTELGNPMAPVANEIIFAVCGVINRCNSQVTLDSCRAAFSNTNGVNIPLSLPSSYSNLASIMQAEQTGTLVSNASAGGACYDSINTLACSDPLMRAAYVATAVDPYAGAVNLISSQVCGSTFTPVAQYSCSNKIFLRGASNTNVSPEVNVQGWTYSVSPALPAGLTLDSATGVISGSPTVVTPATTYTVTVSSAAGVSSTSIVIRTADGYLVNDLTDKHNAGPGCSTPSGSCTLRAALEAINSGSTAHVVVVPPGQINLTLGSELAISQPMDIYGDCTQSATIDGQSATRVFHVLAGPTSLQNLVIQNGVDSSAGGAGIYLDGAGGSFSATLSNVTLQNNTYSGTGFGGGGLRVAGNGKNLTVTMSNSLITNNVSSLRTGGGLMISGAQFTGTNLEIMNNTAVTGGGVEVDGTATISQSLFLRNTSTGGVGGAVYANASGSILNLVNDTITGNSSSLGGAVSTGNSGLLNVTNSTIVNNSGGAGGAGINTNDSIATVTLVNSIVAGNTSGGVLSNCSRSGNLVTSNGYNLSDNSDCGLAATGDSQNQNPLLGPLQGNGGFTPTLALLPGSPAIDQAGVSSCPSVDQRGAPRLTDGKCDIGAFEVQ